MRFEHPQILWLALASIPALVAFLFWAWRVKQKLILQFLSARLAPGLMAGVSTAREKLRLALLVASVAAILCALARPQWGFAWEEARQQGLDIIVAMDTSRSMLARDVVPNRIEKSKLAVMDLMRLAKTDRLGLVVFAGEGFLQAPLTIDDQAFQQSVEAVSVGIVPVGGTSLSSAILTALQAFGKGNDNHKVLVLFTDGDDHDADADTLAAAKQAAEAGMHIFTIGVGTPGGELIQVTDPHGETSYVKDDEGNVVKSRLNEPLLRQIATETGGFYLPLQGANPMETLYARGLAPLPKTTETTRLAQVYREQYHWFLGFAILCLIIEVLLPQKSRSPRPRSASAAAAALALLLFPFPGHASPSSAFRDFKSGKFKSAFKEYSRLAEQKTNDYRLHYDAGVAAYKAKEWNDAQEQFSTALSMPSIISSPLHQQQTYYNLGNSLYHLGEDLTNSAPDKAEDLWLQAIANYTNAIGLNTNDLDARNNVVYVHQQLEQLEKQQQQKQKDKDQEDSEPSGAAKAAKAQADEAVKQRQYRTALDIMENSLKQDQTTQYYAEYIKRLQEVNGVDESARH
jgi:Ca-activated chloride channel family protein